MKFISSKLSALATMGLLSLALNTQAAACNVSDAIGKWGYSAQGINVAAGGIPFSEIGAFTLKADGTGKGVAHHVTNGIYIPNIPVTVNNFTIDPTTCLGTGSISVGPNPPQAHTFLLTSQGKEIHIINASGANTSLGIAKKL